MLQSSATWLLFVFLLGPRNVELFYVALLQAILDGGMKFGYKRRRPSAEPFPSTQTSFNWTPEATWSANFWRDFFCDHLRGPMTSKPFLWRLDRDPLGVWRLFPCWLKLCQNVVKRRVIGSARFMDVNDRVRWDSWCNELVQSWTAAARELSPLAAVR